MDENISRLIGAVRSCAGRARRRRGLPRGRKHQRTARLLRRGVASKNRKTQSGREGGRESSRAIRIQGPVSGGGRPDHRQAEGHLSRLLKSSESDRSAFAQLARKVERQRKPMAK